NQSVAVVRDDFLRGAARGNARRRCAHRLEVDETESLLRAGHDEKRRVAVQSREPRLVHQSNEGYGIGGGFLAQARGVIAIARDDQTRVGNGTPYERPRLDQRVVPLVSFPCAHAADDEPVRPLKPFGGGPGHGGGSRATHCYRNAGKGGTRSTKSRDGM